MEDRIILDKSGLFDQAPSSAFKYYVRVETLMEDRHGKEWCEKHPEVIAKLAEVAANDYHTMMICKTLQQVQETIGGQLHFICTKIE